LQVSQDEKMSLTGLIEQERVSINHPIRTDCKIEESILKKKINTCFWALNFSRTVWIYHLGFDFRYFNNCGLPFTFKSIFSKCFSGITLQLIPNYIYNVV
jgi:hypothetical protein